MRKKNKSIYLYLFLVLVVGFIFFIDKDRNTEVKKVEVQVKVDKSIYEKESKTIKKLENYIVPTRQSMAEESFLIAPVMFNNKKVTIEDLKDRDKMYIVLAYLDKDGFFEDKKYYQVFDDEGKELEKPKKISERKYNSERKDQVVYKKITTEKINKISLKIFNEEINIPKSIVYDGDITCIYEKDLECSKSTSASYKPINHLKYVSSEIKDDEVYIYQKYLAETHLNGISTILTPFENINEKYDVKEVTTGVLNKYGQTYKTTYKKNKDGNFYWYSTEPVLDNK